MCVMCLSVNQSQAVERISVILEGWRSLEAKDTPLCKPIIRSLSQLRTAFRKLPELKETPLSETDHGDRKEIVTAINTEFIDGAMEIVRHLGAAHLLHRMFMTMTMPEAQPIAAFVVESRRLVDDLLGLLPKTAETMEQAELIRAALSTMQAQAEESETAETEQVEKILLN